MRTAYGTVRGREQMPADSGATLSAFPGLRINADAVYQVGNEREGYRVATCWTLIGDHDGPGVYGTPTGRPVNATGISRRLIKEGKFVEGWTVFGLALLKRVRG